jgi:cell division transport system permease protein
MMGTVLRRVFTYGVLSFWRNRWISSATIAIMVITLGLITGLVLLSAITDAVLTNLQEQVDITVYFKLETPEADILQVKSELERFPEVAEVEYVSRDEALARFREARAENPVITQALEQVGENPLEAQLNVRARDISQYGTIASFLEGNRFESLIDEVNFRENQKVIDRLSAIISLVRRAGLILAIILVVVAVLVTFNTIRLTIYSLREEIGVMRLVGGSNWYIRGPFIVEGVLYGVLAAVVTFILFLPVVYFVSPKLIGFLPGIVLWQYFTVNWWQILLLQLILGIGLGVFSSFIAMRRYLKI